jgi:hypothetical protein
MRGKVLLEIGSGGKGLLAVLALPRPSLNKEIIQLSLKSGSRIHIIQGRAALFVLSLRFF